MALRQLVLRSRTGGKFDQAAQEPARLRSHQLPVRTRQPGSPRAAHRRLLADADGARHHPQVPAARQRRVCYPAAAPDQDRRTRYRDRNTGPHRVRRGMSRSRAVPQHRQQPATGRAMTNGASAPEPAHRSNPSACYLRAEIAPMRRLDQPRSAIRELTNLHSAE